MSPFTPVTRRILAVSSFCFALLSAFALRADVVLNEIVAGASDRLLQYDTSGIPRLGAGAPWYGRTFNDGTWQSGAGPFGYGTLTNNPAVPVATRVEALVRNLTPTLYLRRAFAVADADAVRSDALQFAVEYNDGFVAYLNGVEIARRNGGPQKKFIYHDQPAYNRETFSATAPIPTTTLSETITLGSAASLLQAGGENVLAIHALNASATDGTFYIKADLRITGETVVNLVNYNDSWRYLPGVVEPSGNLYDPTLLGSGKLTVPWAEISYDDAAWTSAPGPIGAGTTGGVSPATNLSSQVVNRATSVYTRIVFSADAAAVGETQPLQLAVQYDDGFVAYLNGVEVARRRLGLTNTFTPRDAVADSDNTGAPVTETITLDLPSRLLKVGNNVLAIQVHNSSLTSSDLFIKADLRTASARTLAANNAVWKYLVGTVEPLPAPTGEEEESTPDGPDSASDWVELYNNGSTDVNLAGWSLTDDPSVPRKWIFPNVTIPAGGYLVVFTDGLNITSNPGGYLHTNFSLGQGGEYVGLYDPSATVASQLAPGFPPQSPFHSYVRGGDGAWQYSDTPTPGAANAGTLFVGKVATPTVTNPGRFYSGSVSVTFSTSTPGAVIRYTTDGSEPTLNSNIAAGPITVSSSLALRARAFLNNWLASDVITHTYLISQAVARRSLPAVCVTGDLQRALYRPFGILAISNDSTAAYTGGIWSQYIGNTSGNLTAPNVAPDLMAYNAPMQSGKPAERPVSIEVLHDNITPDLRIDAGLRTAGSPYSRPRYILAAQNSTSPNSLSPWTSSATEKPQLNLFFRDDLGGKPLNYPLVPGSTVSSYENIRLRAGKNDISNPFIRDEFTRRLFLDMGQVEVRGDFVTLYVNGSYKGYYNICERPREKFFQEARRTSSGFDVRYITAMTDGDTLAYNEMVSYARGRDASTYANYLGYMDRMDVANFADYIVLNAYAAMADWPGNNYVMDRERSTGGRYRFSVWDGEGGFGGFSRNPAYSVTFTGDLISSNPAGEGTPAKLFYTQLRKSPEWRLLFADRIQKHFFNNGALDTANFTARYNELKNKIAPLIGSTFSEFLSTWINGVGNTTRYTLSGGTTGSIVNVPSRRKVLFDGFIDDTQGGVSVPALFVSQGLWPATLAPQFSQFGGNVPADFQLSITNPNAGGTIYYTLDGTDPRAVGGAVQGIKYTGSVTISQTLVMRARVQNANGEWSPLTEAKFVVSQAVPLLLTEIMYHPLDQGAIDGDEFEFLELKNVGTQTLNLNGMQFTDGITFTFPAGATLAPGAFAVLAKNATQFAARYPGVPVAGTYGPGSSLSNSGELITLRDLAGNIVFSMSYGDVSPWPGTADGYGNSLVVVNPNSNANPSNPANWRASTAVGGSPGADDPAPAIPAVLVNEVLSNPISGQQDFIELFNPTNQAANVGGWFLSDDSGVPKKYRIPDNTIIAAGGYVVFTEADFNAVPGGANSFALSENGEEVRLSSADAGGSLTGYSHGFSFGAAAPGVSFGRYVTSTNAEKFPALTSPTPGSANASPAIGPVVVTELMYNPAVGGDEFLEIRNISSTDVRLFDPANPANAWRIVGIGLTTPEWLLPTGITLRPRQFMLLTQIDPASFRSKYSIPASIPIYQYPGGLSNGGELIALQKPGVPYQNTSGQTVVPYIDVDVVTYDDVSPWPTTPDGTGPSLERSNWRAFADDPANWRASSNNGGTPAGLAPIPFSSWQTLFFNTAEIGNPAVGGINADPDGDGISNLLEFALGLDPKMADAAPVSETSFSMDGTDGPFLTVKYRRNLSAQGIQFSVDTAGNVGTWSLDTAIQLGAPVNNGDGTETVTRRDTTPANSANQRFIRLRVVGE
ncbi:lamin tail domain-containing protein [Verrucomicrobiota bacterium sgz303538]